MHTCKNAHKLNAHVHFDVLLQEWRYGLATCGGSFLLGGLAVLAVQHVDLNTAISYGASAAILGGALAVMAAHPQVGSCVVVLSLSLSLSLISHLPSPDVSLSPVFSRLSLSLSLSLFHSLALSFSPLPLAMFPGPPTHPSHHAPVCSPFSQVHMWRRSHWANWMFDVDSVDVATQTIKFGKGGYQGCRGGNGSDW